MIEHPKDRRFQNLTGARFGRLVVVRLDSFQRRISDNKKIYFWECVCACGLPSVVSAGNLRGGITSSCGCLRKETAAKTGHKARIHGHAIHGKESRSYRTWMCMRLRCYYPLNKDFKEYGGRGITVCKRWRDSFVSFLEDMGERPEGKTIDRKNSDGNYTKSNCQWSTPKEQANNRRNNKSKR